MGEQACSVDAHLLRRQYGKIELVAPHVRRDSAAWEQGTHLHLSLQSCEEDSTDSYVIAMRRAQ